MSAKQIHITIVLWLFCAFFSSAQEVDTSTYIPEVEWGDLERRKGTLYYFLPNGENEFYALRWTGSRLFGHYTVTKHKDLKLVKATRIKLVANRSIANFEGAEILNDQFVVFLSDKNDGKNNFYLQEFDENLEAKKDVILLASYDLDRTRAEGSFHFRVSPNRKFYGVIWEIPGKKETRDVYGFKIFDREMNLVNEGEYKLPFASDLSEIHEHVVSNSGDLFICLSEYQEPERKSLLVSRLEYKALYIYRLNDDLGQQDFRLDLDGRPVVALSMHTGNNNVFTLTGIYGNSDESAIAGVFYQKMNLDTGGVLQEGFQPFDESFITEDWSERSLKRLERRKRQGKGDSGFFSYVMRDVTFLQDGSIIGTMEQYYVQIRGTSDGWSSQSSNLDYYYYKDIIAYKIDTSGAFAWVKKIEKDQVSVNDGGPYSSFESYVDRGKLHFIFNDNAENYGENNEFLDLDKLESANFGRRKNTVAMVSIDLETGDMERTSFLTRDQNNSLLVPKLFMVSYQVGELILYSISGHKEKIGVIHINQSNTTETE